MIRCKNWCRLLFINVSLLILAQSITTQRLAADEKTEDVVLESRVTAVTLYRSQALVTRTIEIDGAAGAKEFVVENLPENIEVTSLFAEGEEGIEVRAVQYRSRAVSDSPREEVRALVEEARQIEEKIFLNQKKTELLKKQSSFLDKLEGFTPPTADFDLGRGVLDAETLSQLTNFTFGQRDEIVAAEVELSSQMYELKKELSLAQRKLREITNNSTKQQRQAILFAQKIGDGKKKIRLNYLTNSCGWSPTYTVRAQSGADMVRVEYNGLIRQMSGEDWNDVELVLSTASPALSASGPGLAPLRLTLKSGNQSGNRSANQAAPMGQATGGAGKMQQQYVFQNSNDIKSLIRVQNEALSRNRKSVNFEDNTATGWTINQAVNNFDCFAITSDSTASSLWTQQSGDGGEQPALSYKIKSNVSLPSRDNQQMVRVLETDLDSQFYHLATPVLTSYVYREAELSNNSTDDLLAGPLTVYLDGRFVGRGEIPTVARGQTFVVGLGADSQLRARRELFKKTNAINGGNRESKLAYKLVIENYKESAANIRVIDRMPIVDDDSKIRVTLGAGIEDELSEDGVYVRMEYPKGILRWDAEVPARAIGENAYEIDYSYTLEYDRNYSVSLPENLQQQQEEYTEMENFRNKR